MPIDRSDVAHRSIRRARRGALKLWSFTYLQPRVALPVRSELPALLNRRGLTARGAEIGVAAADFSELLLERWNGECLISVDPWLETSQEEYADVTNLDQAAQEAVYQRAKGRLALFGDRSEIWRLASVEAAERVTNRSLDFVYIDARHDYQSVHEDLTAWFPKIRPGGVMAGHDYFDGIIAQGVYGVKSAVDEFFKPRGIRVTSTFAERAWKSWLVVLPSV